VGKTQGLLTLQQAVHIITTERWTVKVLSQNLPRKFVENLELRFWPRTFEYEEDSMEQVCLEELIVPRPSRNSPHFVKREGSLPCSQQPAIRPDPEPD